MQLSSLGNSKMEISETDFFHILTIQNDQISYVKHVLAPLYVFFTLFGCREGGAPQGPGAQPAYVVFQPQQLKNGRSSRLFEVLIVVCGPLKRPMDLWGLVGIYGGLWGPMGTYRGLWGPLGAYGDVSGPEGTFGGLWGPIGACGDLSVPMGGPIGAYQD